MASRTAALLAGVGAITAYVKWARPWLLRWGATDAEVAAALPGDEFVPEPKTNTTRAITIDAPPEDVWPWIAQIGVDKAGFYSYSFLENLAGCGLHNADRLVPEWQDIKLGDRIWLHPRVGLPITRLEPGRTLVLEADWSFHLRPLDGGRRTRLIVRGRGVYRNPDLGPAGNFLYWRVLFEPAHFIMEQKMMTGIKRRAERASEAHDHDSLIDELVPDTRFQGEISVTIAASPENIFQAIREVTPAEMPVARALGELRYVPGRLLGHKPVAVAAAEPFFDGLMRGGTVVLAENPNAEIVLGGAGKYHRIVDQQPLPLQNPQEFRDFSDPGYEKLVMAFQVERSAFPGECVLTFEHRTHPLSEDARRRFARYWLVIKPTGNFVSKQLLLAVKKRAERRERAAC